MAAPTTPIHLISPGAFFRETYSPQWRLLPGLCKYFAHMICLGQESPLAPLPPPPPPHQVTISGLEYADDAALLDPDVNQASQRLTAISLGSRKDAAMEISIPKTKVMHIHKKDRVSKTTDAEISYMGLKNICDRCSRDFNTKRGLSIHQGR